MAEGIVIGNLTIPVIKGDKGDKGNTGEIISISLVLLSPSSTAYAINNGSTTQAQIELGIPKGLSVSTTNINASGELVFTFNDNSTVNVGKVVGKGISEVAVTDDFDFVVTYTDGTSVTACNLEDEVLGTINDILESYYTKTEIDNKGFITKEVNNLTNYTLKTSTGSSIELSINNSTYVMTLNLKNSAGTTISTGTIDLPLETMVVGATYDNTNKKIVLTLKNGSTIDVPVADLVSGLQSEITNANKLNADLVDDTSTTHKFTSTSEKNSWNAKYDKPSGGIPKTDLASDVQTSLGKADTALQAHQDISGKEDTSNKTGTLDSSSTTTQYPNAKTVYDNFVTRDEEIEKLQTENAQLLADHPDILDENNEFPSGTDLTLNGTGDLKMKVDVGGNSTQETTSTSEGDEYDSPSPEHKQDINNVEGNVVVKAHNKNLWDLGIYYNGFCGVTAGGIWNIGNGISYAFETSVLPDTVIVNIEGGNRSNISYWNTLPTTNGQIADSYVENNYTTIPRSFNINKNYKYIIIQVAYNVELSNLSNGQLEEGSTLGDYIEPQSNTVTFPLSQGQKLMLGDYLAEDGIHHVRGQVVLDGSNDEDYSYASSTKGFIFIKDLGIKVFDIQQTGVIKSNYYTEYGFNNLISNMNYGIARYGSTASYPYEKLVIKNIDISTIEAFRIWLSMHNLVVEYPLDQEQIISYTEEQQTAYNKLKEMQSYYDLTYVVGSSDNAQPIITAHAKKSLKVINDEISNINSRLTLLEE